MSEPYAQYPRDPYPGHRRQPPAAAPADVQTSFKLWIADIVIGVVATLLLFTLPGEVIVPRSELPPGVDPATADAIVLGAIIFGVVLGLVLLALQLLFVFKMRAGRNWARIVLTVLGGIGLLGGLFGLGRTLAFLAAGGLGVLVGLLSLVQLVILAAAILFMYRPAANAYFR